MKCSSKLRLFAGWLLVVAGFVFCVSPTPAQQTTGTVTGVVQDATGAIIPRATVVLTDLSTQVRAQDDEQRRRGISRSLRCPRRCSTRSR